MVKDKILEINKEENEHDETELDETEQNKNETVLVEIKNNEIGQENLKI